MSPELTFLSGLLLLILFGWYFATHRGRAKRILGSTLTVLLMALCLVAVNPPNKAIRLGLDLQGGTSFLIRLLPEGQREIRPDTLDQAVEVIRNRVDRFGGGEPIITPQGTDRILVQIPGLYPEQIATARQQLQQVARLEFRLVHPQSDELTAPIAAGTQVAPPGYRVETHSDTRNGKPIEEKLLVRQRADLLGNRVHKAFATFDQQGWGISLQFDREGADLFGKLTAAHVHERFAIVLDGKVQSAPVIKDAIYGGQASITGNFTEKEARDLASVLENPLQNPVKIIEERSVSSTLGADSIKSGVYSGVLGLALTFGFVLIYYRFAGLVATVALVINLILLFGAMSLFNFVLTLPGIAGIILTIGMAVDANVLIYERLREELASGKPLRAALEAAYEKAFSAIFDSNLTTLITAAILFWKATGPVKGFAVTLSIGIVASMFSALLVTRNCFGWAIETGWLQRIRMSNLIKATNFDFLGKRRLSVGLSVAVIAAAVSIFALRGEKNFGVDFKGGDLLVFEARQWVSEAEVRAALQEINLAESVVQTERSPDKEFLTIRSAPGTSDQITKHLQARFPHAGFLVEQNDKVGKLVGDELARNSLIALGLGLAGIFLYVAARFELSFAVAAIIALLHDVILTVGAFALFDRELSLIIVGAVLTIAGYSINDTIVVFDRIREGIRDGEADTLETIMNRSINDTLSRTILTGGTTVLSTLALYFLGGPVLHDFAFAILIGILVGTYSSIFVASPIVLWWSRLKGGLPVPVNEPVRVG
ncbi:MAG: SecD/SecF fusion protein [Chthoniobacter sp.]|jgi:SecD/SecF fusion protein|nr:SecD/SecF fusion protein [Chthoniobacter sp.]